MLVIQMELLIPISLLIIDLPSLDITYVNVVDDDFENNQWCYSLQ